MTHAATVALKACDSYQPEIVRKAVRDSFGLLGGIEAFVQPGERILLKPNFVAKSSPKSPACTHPEVILAVAREVRERGAVPIIGDSPAFGSAEGLARHIGLLPQAREEGFEVRTLRRSEIRSVHLGDKEFRLAVSKEALDCDGIINLPKFKAHRQATFTFGTKNLYGCVTGKRKPCRHFASGGDLEWFSNMLVANAKILSPRLTLVDGIIAMEGLGPVKGTERPLGVLVAGTDVTAVDTVCCRIVQYPPTQLCTIRAARRLGLGVWDPAQIEMLGDPVIGFEVSDFEIPPLIPIFFSLPRLLKGYLRSFREAMAPE